MIRYLLKIPRPLRIVFICLFVVWISAFLYIRVKSDREHKNVEFVFSLNELEKLCNAGRYPLEFALARLEALNIKVALLKGISHEEWLKENSLELAISRRQKRDILGDKLYRKVGDRDFIYAADGKDLSKVKEFFEDLFMRPAGIVTQGGSAALPLENGDLWLLRNLPMGLSSVQIDLLKKYNMECLAEISADSRSSVYVRPEWLERAYFSSDIVRLVLVRGKRFLGWPGRTVSYARYFLGKSLRLVKLEFYNQAGLTEAGRQMSNFVLPSHDLAIAGGSFLHHKGKLATRFARALKERSVRLVILHPFSDGSVEDSFIFWRELVKSSVKSGFVIGSRGLPFYKAKGSPVGLQQLLAFILAILIPLITLKIMVFFVENSSVEWKSVVSAFLLTNIITFFGALNIYALLSTNEFVLRIHHFRGVKLALLIPVLFAFYELVERAEWRKFFNFDLKIKHIAYFSAAAVIVLVAVLRTGNVSVLPAIPFEGVVRDFFDDFLGVRPRFKEILFGQPLLLFGLWLWIVKGRASLINYRLGRLCVAAGFLGQTTIVNTFTHPHTPVLLSISRTFYGLVIGALVGLVLIGIVKYIPKIRLKAYL